MRASLPLLLGAGAVLIGFPAVGTVIDPSLAETQLLTSITGQATGMAWAPDGSNRLFVLDKLGDVWVVQLGVDAAGAVTATRLPTPFTTVKRADGGPLFTNSECGLIGLAFDPSFATNHFVYFFATVSSTEQQILRFRDAGGAGADRTVILPGLPTHGVNHDGGGMAFDHEGKLHFAIGDQGDGTGVFRTGGDVQTELSTLAAKSSRINRDGSIPSDNPFFDGAGGNADAIFARGLRNPFRMAIQPSTGLVWQLVTGDRWEQVFVLTPGANAGWDAFQNDQDGQTGLLVPVIAYLTNASAANPHQRTITSASRAGGVATFTTSTPHQFRRGTRLTIAGVSDASFDGTQYVATVVSTTQFTAPSAGPDASATGGTATALVIGGAITDGAFVQGTLLPAEWRGNFVFADLNSGNVVRARLDGTNQPTQVDLAANVGSGAVGVASGPDGALYVLTFSGTLYRYGQSAGLSPGLIIDRSPLRLEEDGSAALSVRLATVPAGVVTVDASLGGPPETTIASGRTLTFTPANWQLPQAVTVAAALDPDADDSRATLTLSAAGLPTETVPVLVRDIDVQALTLSTNSVSLVEGGAAGSFTVRLARQPATATTVAVARTSGSSGISVTSGAMLTFTTATFDVPQAVTVAAAADADEQPSSAVLTISSTGAPARTVAVVATDPGQAAPTSPPTGGCGNCASVPGASLWALAALLAARPRRAEAQPRPIVAAM